MVDRDSLFGTASYEWHFQNEAIECDKKLFKYLISLQDTLADEIKAFAEHLKPYPFLKNCYPFLMPKGLLLKTFVLGSICAVS